MKNKKEQLRPDAFYHIYNRANGKERLFVNPGNYNFFLKRYKKYIHPIGSTFAYCLMPNHFHFLVLIREEKEIVQEMQNQNSKYLSALKDSLNTAQLKIEIISKFISLQFSHFFNGYAQAFNKQQNRRGSLFMAPYKRILIENEEYFRRLIRYIHYNPIMAGLAENIYDWEYSSYNAIISEKPTLVSRNEILSYFNDKDNFIYWHKSEQDISTLF